jgi:hypothetical protein
MGRHRLAAALAGAAVLFWAGEAAGQSLCAERASVAARLASEFHESQLATGIHSRDGVTLVIEIWASEDGSFTILGTNAAGLACLLMAGEGFAPTPPEVPTESH